MHGSLGRSLIGVAGLSQATRVFVHVCVHNPRLTTWPLGVGVCPVCVCVCVCVCEHGGVSRLYQSVCPASDRSGCGSEH